MSSAVFELLPGLPGEGPLPLQFSPTGQGMHREGCVIRFSPISGESWVGNFQPGLSSFSAVIVVGQQVVVVACGQAYVVDPVSRQLVGVFGAQIESAQLLDQGLLVSNGLWFELFAGGVTKWRSQRVSWDGLRNISIQAGVIVGEGWRYDNAWHPFTISVSNGATVGGAYDGPTP